MPLDSGRHRVFFTDMIEMENTTEITEQEAVAAKASAGIFARWNNAMMQMFVLKGRASRYDFWAFQAVSLIIFLLMVLCGSFFGATKIVINIFALYFLFPATAATVRRLHDISLSGWWCLPAVVLALLVLGLWDFGHTAGLLYLLFASLVYYSFLCWILCGRGVTEANKYGEVVDESADSNLDSRAFMCFMFAFWCGMWVVFLCHIW